ncbi:MAG: hypothetical protein P8Z37_09690 [Acidobacteriota bacterium]|jgi:hypothetical protein
MRLAAAICFIIYAFSPAQAQYIVNARAGLITSAHGQLYLDKKPFHFTQNRYEELAKGQRLETTSGLAEIQLGPAASLWMGLQGSIGMLSPNITNTVVRLERGEIFIEIAEKYKKNKISVQLGNAVVELKEIGRYYINSTPPQLHVLEGKAGIQRNDRGKTVKKGKAVDLSDRMNIFAFREDWSNQLLDWANKRSNILFYPVRMARRMEALRRQMDNLRYFRDMQEFQQMQIQQMQMEQLRQRIPNP